MLVYNLTDVETPKLVQHGLSNQSIVVGTKMIHPGEKEDVLDLHMDVLSASVEHLVAVGAIAVGELPPEYKLAKDRKPAAKAAATTATTLPAPPETTPEVVIEDKPSTEWKKKKGG